MSDLFLAVIYLAKGKEVLFPQAEGVFPDGVAEHLGKTGLDIFECIDAKAIDVVFCNQVLVGADQSCPHGPVQAALLAEFLEFGVELLEAEEVAADLLFGRRPIKCVAAPAHEIIAAQFLGPERRVGRWIVRRVTPVGAAAAVNIPPTDWVLLVTPGSHPIAAAVGQDVFEHVTGVVQHDVKDDVDTAGVGSVHQGT